MTFLLGQFGLCIKGKAFELNVFCFRNNSQGSSPVLRRECKSTNVKDVS